MYALIESTGDPDDEVPDYHIQLASFELTPTGSTRLVTPDGRTLFSRHFVIHLENGEQLDNTALEG